MLPVAGAKSCRSNGGGPVVSSPAGGDGVLPLSWQVRQVRERLCLSQEDLAARTGLSVRTICWSSPSGVLPVSTSRSW